MTHPEFYFGRVLDDISGNKRHRIRVAFLVKFSLGFNYRKGQLTRTETQNNPD